MGVVLADVRPAVLRRSSLHFAFVMSLSQQVRWKLRPEFPHQYYRLLPAGLIGAVRDMVMTGFARSVARARQLPRGGEFWRK